MPVPPSARRATETSPQNASPVLERVVALDGLRGLMTIFVVASHYFAEVPHGLGVFAFGWVAVDTFFVLSGYLVGKLILEKRHHVNFVQVFYIRRACRTLPIYFLCLTATLGLLAICDPSWSGAGESLPSWSYLLLVQNAAMAASGSVGAHWLAPTWTLALEEHFYLVVPLLFVLTPRRRLVPVLLALVVGALAYRAAIMLSGTSPLAALSLLPGRADSLALGLLAALAVKTEGFPWARLDQPLRVAPIVLLVCAFLIGLWGGEGHPAVPVLGHLLVSGAAAAFLLTLVRGAPEAVRFRSRTLCFFGHNSYAIYLTHLPVVGLMHGLLLGAEPDIADPRQWLVTLAALPVCIGVSRLLTRFVEEPITAYGRSWAWRDDAKPAPASALAAGVA